MKIDFYKLEENLQKHKVTGKFSSSDWGVAKVIQYVWNHTDTRHVNFDSFSLDEGLRAFYEFYTLPHSDDEITAADKLAMKGNMWEINANVDNLIAEMTRYENRVYEQDEEDFI
ncbi:hypothetical protein FAY30_26455 (plasmid) [Bacillus sp. S3]|uniref:hypothetical protein n=1 Tax=Bacillus sp. S3 TaxID=486398 RepID=UPI00118A81E3|nr:hypothetical protein [Bacillus sp. S3]QCJ45484.1 hypothetical protein FAY30_26455 [Bacillus sp. S3]